MHWKIAEAKQELSRVVRAAATEPQWIHNRDVAVALVIGAKDGEAFLAWKQRHESETIATALDEVAALASAEDYVLEAPTRSDRVNDFVAPPPVLPRRVTRAR